MGREGGAVKDKGGFIESNYSSIIIIIIIGIHNNIIINGDDG